MSAATQPIEAQPSEDQPFELIELPRVAREAPANTTEIVSPELERWRTINAGLAIGGLGSFAVLWVGRATGYAFIPNGVLAAPLWMAWICTMSFFDLLP